MATLTVQGLDAIDTDNLQQIKDVMAEKAIGGDAAAATAYAHLLNAETNRQQLLVSAAGVEIEQAPAPSAAPSTWQESLREGGRPVAVELAA